MLNPSDLHRYQVEQYAHDRRNHTDILCLPKPDRLKHYGLHFAKYVGRLARGTEEPKSPDRTLVDCLLVSLSAANTLHQNLALEIAGIDRLGKQIDPLYMFADAAGRFADACEKIDHLEDFVPLAKRANVDIVKWVLSTAEERGLNVPPAIQKRRQELALRQFYIAD